MRNLGLMVLIFFVGFVYGMMLTHSLMNIDKRDCEATLPRNVECVWAPPEVVKGE